MGKERVAIRPKGLLAAKAGDVPRSSDEFPKKSSISGGAHASQVLRYEAVGSEEQLPLAANDSALRELGSWLLLTPQSHQRAKSLFIQTVN